MLSALPWPRRTALWCWREQLEPEQSHTTRPPPFLPPPPPPPCPNPSWKPGVGRFPGPWLLCNLAYILLIGASWARLLRFPAFSLQFETTDII